MSRMWKSFTTCGDLFQGKKQSSINLIRGIGEGLIRINISFLSTVSLNLGAWGYDSRLNWISPYYLKLCLFNLIHQFELSQGFQDPMTLKLKVNETIKGINPSINTWFAKFYIVFE